MQDFHQILKIAQSGVVHRLGNPIVFRFDDFEVNGTEIIPQQFVRSHQRVAHAELRVVFVDFGQALRQFGPEPFHGGLCAVVGGYVGYVRPVMRRNEFQILLLKLRPCSRDDSSNNKSLPAGELSSMPTRTPSASVRFDEFDGIGRVAERFAHLAALFVAHDARVVHVAEGTSPRYSKAGR